LSGCVSWQTDNQAMLKVWKHRGRELHVLHGMRQQVRVECGHGKCEFMRNLRLCFCLGSRPCCQDFSFLFLKPADTTCHSMCACVQGRSRCVCDIYIFQCVCVCVRARERVYIYMLMRWSYSLKLSVSPMELSTPALLLASCWGSPCETTFPLTHNNKNK
jgi:hypothetical protein